MLVPNMTGTDSYKHYRHKRNQSAQAADITTDVAAASIFFAYFSLLIPFAGPLMDLVAMGERGPCNSAT